MPLEAAWRITVPDFDALVDAFRMLNPQAGPRPLTRDEVEELRAETEAMREAEEAATWRTV